MEEKSPISTDKKGIGYAPIIFGVASFIPFIGVVFGVVAIVWGLVRIKVGGVKPVILGVCGIPFSILLSVTLLNQVWVSPVRFKFYSPVEPKDEVWLIMKGFQDRGISAYAKPKGERARRIATFDFEGIFVFGSAQWSADGKIIVFNLSVYESERVSKTIRGFAYDFEEMQAIVPYWQVWGSTTRKTIIEWKEHEKVIDNRVAEHGGLKEKSVYRWYVNEFGSRIIIWQIPRS